MRYTRTQPDGSGPSCGRRPIPPVGGLRDHFGARACPGDHLRQQQRIVDDLPRLDRVTQQCRRQAALALRERSAAAAVQIDTDILCSTGGLPSTLGCCGRPSFPTARGPGGAGPPPQSSTIVVSLALSQPWRTSRRPRWAPPRRAARLSSHQADADRALSRPGRSS